MESAFRMNADSLGIYLRFSCYCLAMRAMGLNLAMKEVATPPSAVPALEAEYAARNEPLTKPARGLDQDTIDRLMAQNDGSTSAEAAVDTVDASLRAQARALGMTNEFIKRCRLSGSRPAMRVCVMCGAQFLSSGIDNRRCRRCPRG